MNFHICLFPCIADIRETAFVYAITAAGVTHAVTQACSMGDLLQCGCEATRNRPPPKPLSSSSYGDGVKWEWGGCADDVEFGYEKSKQFMDAKRRRGKSDIRALIDLHNNEAGRLVRDDRSGFYFLVSPFALVPSCHRCHDLSNVSRRTEESAPAVFVLIFLQESGF